MQRGFWIAGVLVTALSITAVAASAHDGNGRRGGPERMPIAFEELDANADGQVTPEEMAAHRTARFEAADTNGDGLLSADEMLAQRDSQRAEKRGDRAARMIERMDANGDGGLSLEELQGRRDPAKMFERLDANEDGSISAEEFADARKHMRGHRGEGRGRD